MSATVYANGMRVSGKASNNMSNGAMPDVCLSPPSPPAGPLPIPYPNFSKASDTDQGSKTVTVEGKEVGLKDSSNYKSSKGNEAATKSFGMGLVSKNLSGATHHAAWSFDVKFEGKNAIRHMDMTTHNHGSNSNLALTMDLSDMAPATSDEPDCKELEDNNATQQKKDTKLKRIKRGQTSVAGHFKPPNQSAVFANAMTPQGVIKSSSLSKFCAAAAQRLVKKKGENKLSPAPKRACTAERFKFRRKGHSEAKIIQKVFQKAKAAGMAGGAGANLGTLTMNIDWRPTKGPASDKPCDDCKTLLCEAMDCGLKIQLCAKGADKPKPYKC